MIEDPTIETGKLLTKISQGTVDLVWVIEIGHPADRVRDVGVGDFAKGRFDARFQVIHGTSLITLFSAIVSCSKHSQHASFPNGFIGLEKYGS
jgi:hypothetical protein